MATKPIFGSTVKIDSTTGNPIRFGASHNIGNTTRQVDTKMIVSIPHITVKAIRLPACTMPDRISISAMKLAKGGKPSRAKIPTANSMPVNGRLRITPLSGATSLVPYTARMRPAVRNNRAFTKALLTM